jgi:hypothetical protein
MAVERLLLKLKFRVLNLAAHDAGRCPELPRVHLTGRGIFFVHLRPLERVLIVMGMQLFSLVRDHGDIWHFDWKVNMGVF